MAVNYPMYPQQQNYMPAPQYLKGRPVASIDEVRATSIDFDGSVFYFPDLANKRIYTKQINLNGTSTLNVYELKAIPEGMQPNYITREEFDNTIAQILNRLPQPAQQQDLNPQPQPNRVIAAQF